MKDTVMVALIVGVVGPGLTVVLTDWRRRRDRNEEWQRQDRLAAEARADRAAVGAKLAVIEKTGAVTHELVNSRYRDAKQRELESTIRELASLRSLVALRRAGGDEPSDEDQQVIDQTVDAIEVLRQELEALDVKTDAASRL